jgi:PTH1 family peptidyl-tRNA hydrolase
MTILIVGLGNPAPEYSSTRHNAGAMFVDRFLEKLGAGSERWQSKFDGLFAEINSVEHGKILLLKPQTYMNASGKSVDVCMKFFKIASNNLVVVHDELELPPGEAKLKLGGGHGGHNGVRDIHQAISTNEYARLRIGIGRPENKSDVRAYVLGRFMPQERELIGGKIDELIAGAAELFAKIGEFAGTKS